MTLLILSCLQDDGYIAKLLVPAGTKDIQVGTAVGVLVEEKEDVSSPHHNLANSVSERICQVV